MVASSRAFLFLVVAAGAALAGCTSDELDPDEDAAVKTAEEAVVTEETGSIRGQVMTVDLEPVAGEAVALIPGGGTAPIMSTVTDLQGRFTFNKLQPEGYRVHIAPACCEEALKPVVVTAGAVADISLLLERNQEVEPFVREVEWNGFVDCSVWYVNPCVTASQNQRELQFEVAQGLRTLVLGMTWQASGGLSKELELIVDRLQNPCYSCDYYRETHPSPIRFWLDDEAIQNDATSGNDEATFANITNEGLKMRIIVNAPQTGVAYQQAFTIYWKEFYNAPAPEGTEALPEG